LERVWKATDETTNGFCEAPAYPNFLKTVREVNSKLPMNARIRVFGGHPGPAVNGSIENTAISVLKEQALQNRGKALVIFGAAHFYRTLPPEVLPSLGGDAGLGSKLGTEFPGRSFVVIPVGPLAQPQGVTGDIQPDFQKFDRALTTHSRPVLVSFRRLPFRDFKAEEFLGRTVTTCSKSRGCVSMFKNSVLTLGQVADAGIYVGGAALLAEK
jgi:hypothetical protein